MDISNNKIHQHGNSRLQGLNVYGKTEDYSPLFTMYRPPLATPSFYRTSWLDPKLPDISSDSAKGQQHLYKRGRVMYDKGTRLEKIIASNTNNLIPGDHSFKELKFLYEEYAANLGRIKRELAEGVHKSRWTYEVKKPSYSGNSYADMFDACLRRNGWAVAHIRSGSYITNLWYLANYNNSANTWRSQEQDLPSKGLSTLCCLMVKSEMLPYVRLCSLLNEPPHPDALELWVREGFDVPKGEFKQIRPHYRKHIKKAAIDAGIKIVTVPDIDKFMYHRHTPAKAKSIAERKNNVEAISDAFINSKSVEIFARNSNISLSLKPFT
jgi:hypothetical protein